MAEGIESAKSVKSGLAVLVKPLLECAICVRSFTNPLVLPCLHSFCSKCLESHVSATKKADETFNCPSCRQAVSIPTGGLDDFPKNSLASSLNEIVPSAVLKELKSTGGVIQCRHSGQQAGEGLHGPVAVFCPQCDAYLCERCAGYHKMADALKGHGLKPVGGREANVSKRAGRCVLHEDQRVNWYCKSCSQPGCSDCILENHRAHDAEKLTVMAAMFQEDLQDIYKLASKRLQAFEEIVRELKSNKIKMETDLDQVEDDITVTEQSICAAIKWRAAAFKEALRKEREDVRGHFKAAEEQIEKQREKTSRVESYASTLCTAQGLCTFAVQVPKIKKQFLHQQQTTAPSIVWRMEKQNCGLAELPTATSPAEAEMKSLVQRGIDDVQYTTLRAPCRVTKLEYSGTAVVSGLAVIHGELLCVTHHNARYIWVYDGDGELKKKVWIPRVNACGIETLDGARGLVALVDKDQDKVHLITLSEDLEVERHVDRSVPFVCKRLTLNNKGHLVPCPNGVKKCAVLTSDGELLNSIHLEIPGGKVNFTCVLQTASGFVICDLLSRRVFFVNDEGEIRHTSDDCSEPTYAVATSWGHVLVADQDGQEIKVFAEDGEIIGSVQGCSEQIERPHFVHLDESKRLLHVGCGPPGGMELRTYKFCPSELPSMPVSRTITRLEMSVKLATPDL